MVFSSIPFLFYFLPLLLGVYYLIPTGYRGARNATLLIASLLFYSWGEGDYIIVLIVSILINHYIGQRIQKSNTRFNLLLGVGLNLLILGHYKYAGFIVSLLGNPDWNSPKLPLGVSFFTFQAISYLIDVSRRDAKATNSLMNTALYICSFPQLIAGPIVRYKDIATQILHRKESIEQFALGVQIFVLGLAQKVLIANTVGQIADQAFTTAPHYLSTAEAWYGLLAYSLQIFFDFAGYSNMAIGLGKMMGFTFPKNFNAPYSSTSVTEFWRRWHMTLSNWFRDYLYIPLGGNRYGQWRTIANLWIVFLLCGFWHGANWTFLLWGAWHGFFLSIERIGLSRLLAQLWLPIRHLYLIITVFLGWVLFRAESAIGALHYYFVLFGLGDGSGSENLLVIRPNMLLFMALALFLASGSAQKLGKTLFDDAHSEVLQNRHPALVCIALVCVFSLLIMSVAAISGSSYNPFIYFRF